MITEILPWPLYSLFHVEDEPSSPPTGIKNEVANLLRHYETPGVSPPHSRINPNLKRLERRPIRIWDVWKYGAIVAYKATEIAGDALSHTIWGPRKKSWGIQMTLITSLMRDLGRHSALVDITTIRMLMGLGGLVPLPSDALVTPVTFRVRQRGLRGILAKYDAQEDGSRELSGEWVVGKKLWQRLQADWKNEQQTPRLDKKIKERQKERVVLYLHGGAYYLSSAAAQRLLSIPLSKYTDTRVFALDYRLAPETNFPGPLHDAATGYFRLTEDLRIPPENIVLAGDSAGGGLCLALMLYLRDNNYPLPSGAILMSPWVDLTMSCESWDSNAAFDVVPVPAPDDHLNPVGLYLGEDMDYLTHPYASPLFGDLRGLPPLLIQSGDSEVLRDEITLLAHKATLAGVDVQHELYEDCVHVFQAFPFLEAAHRALISCRAFVHNVLPRPRPRSPRALSEEKLEHEIDNENIRVVRGDGVVTGSGREDLNEKLQDDSDEGDSGTEKADDEAEVTSHYSSWGRSRSSSILQPLSPIIPKAEPSGTKTPHEEMELGTSNLRRIQSALSMLTSGGSPSIVSPARTRHHSRTPSAQSISRPGYTKRFTGHMPISPDLNMSTVASPPPSPSIRRRNVSHPDITSLVDQWTASGPANQTTMYKAHKLHKDGS